MHRLVHHALLSLLLLISPLAFSQSGPVNGLIVQLKAASGVRETPQAAHERVAALARDSSLALADHRPLSGNHHLMRLSAALSGNALDAALRRLRLNPDVLSVEPDVRLHPSAVPNDPGFAQQWHLQTPGVNAAAINMPPAWDRSTGNNGVIAVLDTGIRFTHPDLQGRLLPGYDLVSEVEFANDGDGRDPDPSDPGDWVTAAETRTATYAGCLAENSSWHGTFIAGQLGALTNNGAGIAGLSWNARILPVRISGKCGALLSDILDGIRWAAGLSVTGLPINPNPARIINLSFGGDVACTSSYQSVIDEVTAAGSLLVVAGGNDGGALKRPADCRNVLSVGAVRADGAKTSYSNFGANVSLMAPGGASSSDLPIYSSDNAGTQGPTTDGYGTKVGTSFSAPLASGVASLMLSLNPTLTPVQIVARMRAGARAHASSPQLANCTVPFSSVCNCTTDTCGAGLLDANGALLQAMNPVVVIAPVTPPATGATVLLDGRGSSAATGRSVVSYQWTQIAGTTLPITNGATALAAVNLPAQAGSFSFKLRVQDSSGLASEDQITITSTAPGGSGGGGGGGGGASGLWWGLALWLLAATAWWRQRRAQAAGQRS
jgi:serine protease